MTSIAGGMESDSDDLDCDLVSASTNTYVGFEASKTPTIAEQKLPTTYEKNSLNGVATGHDSKSIGNKNNCVSSSRTRFPRTSRRLCIDAKSSQLLDDLRYAIMKGSVEDTRAILDKGVMVDTILKAGWTGLMYACSSGQYEIVTFLLENKADPNYHRDMFTPLMAACASCKFEEDLLKCCILLLDKGANVNVRERHFATPLIFAVREGHLKIVAKLLEHDADVHICDNRNRTALLWAALGGFGQIVRLLMKNGADPQHVDNMGQNAADLAYSEGHKEIASLIEKYSVSKESLIDIKVDEKSSSSSKEVSERKMFTKPAVFSNSDGNIIKQGELELFLTGLGYQELISLFHEHKLNFTDLLVMNEEELEKIGINKIGVRKNILEASKAVHKTNWEPTSLPSLKQCQFISCPDAVAMMANIAKHLKYISSTVIYVRQQIQSQPRILELAQEAANVHNLLDEMEESLKNVRFLNDELRFLKMHLDKIQDNEKFIPADLIVETVSARRKTVQIAFGITIVSVGIGALFWKYPDFLYSAKFLVLVKSPFFRGT